MTIRAYQRADADALYDICVRTGADGADARPAFRDPRLLGSVYVGPYLALEPHLAFVLDDAGPGGYVLAARDTVAFGRACEEHWWPALRAQYPVSAFPAGSADAGIVAMLHDPPVADPDVLRSYPSHLHIDLLPRIQGAGWGRRLIARALLALAAAGSPGVHLGVSATNDRARGFYHHMGFVELASGPGYVTMGHLLGHPRERIPGANPSREAGRSS